MHLAIYIKTHIMVSACTVSGQPDWNSLEDKMKLTKMQEKANVDLISSHWALLLRNKTHLCILRESIRDKCLTCQNM